MGKRNYLVLLTLLLLMWPRQSAAQLAPTGAHYAGRPSDTGHIGPSVDGRFSASIALDLPQSRGGLPIPVQVISTGRGFGAAGLGWDVPLSYVQVDTSFIRRRPLAYSGTLPVQRERITVALPGRRAEMVLLPQGDRWVGRHDPDLVLDDEGGGWRVFDGSGRTFTFHQCPAQQPDGRDVLHVDPLR